MTIRSRDVVVIRILDARVKMFLPSANQFTARITLKGRKKEIVVDQKSYTQI